MRKYKTRKHKQRKQKTRKHRRYTKKQRGGESDFLVSKIKIDSEPITSTKTPVATMGQVLPLDVLASRSESYDGMNPVA
jgi:hypothetical protein